MTDFIVRNISTNVNETVRVANKIAKQQAAFVSNFNEVTDLYLASKVCRSFLITAPTSTFGWWLAFFIKDQNAVFYLPDNHIHGDKIPSKELFLLVYHIKYR
ncbi:hypothetical protein KIN20_005693 [Parelaphostrongylus tenuis]|uniref:Uncharacterized protein n=1 Tax=Parelaphostrongylus tenuis TaxID=148309 RepID=A0AAD5M0I8_PARTN|nr:hypothetical protein KIN20_005693 [Parelaphostrongylus tenuis]